MKKTKIEIIAAEPESLEFETPELEALSAAANKFYNSLTVEEIKENKALEQIAFESVARGEEDTRTESEQVAPHVIAGGSPTPKIAHIPAVDRIVDPSVDRRPVDVKVWTSVIRNPG